MWTASSFSPIGPHAARHHRYADHLANPTPLRIRSTDTESFDRLSPDICRLLRREASREVLVLEVEPRPRSIWRFSFGDEWQTLIIDVRIIEVLALRSTDRGYSFVTPRTLNQPGRDRENKRMESKRESSGKVEDTGFTRLFEIRQGRKKGSRPNRERAAAGSGRSGGGLHAVISCTCCFSPRNTRRDKIAEEARERVASYHPRREEARGEENEGLAIARPSQRRQRMKIYRR